MKKPLAILWENFKSQNVIVSKTDGNEYIGQMFVFRSLVQQTRTQFIGTTKIHHLIVNNVNFNRSGNDSFHSDKGEVVILKRLA